MSGVRRRGVGLAVLAVIGAALVAGLVMSPGERPVDVRLVAPKPAPAETVSASMTTTMSAVAAQPPVVEQPPVDPVITTTKPAAVPAPTTTSTKHSGLLPDLIEGLCSYVYKDNRGIDRCVPWVLDMEDACEWLKEQGINKIEVRGRDEHGLDLDLDGIACKG